MIAMTIPSLNPNPRAVMFTATHGAQTVVDKLLDVTMVIKSAYLFAANAVIGDSLTIDLIDKDNVLGAGGTPESPFVVARALKEWFVMPNVVNTFIDDKASAQIQGGLYFRITYTSVGQTTDPVVVVNLLSFEVS